MAKPLPVTRWFGIHADEQFFVLHADFPIKCQFFLILQWLQFPVLLLKKNEDVHEKKPRDVLGSKTQRETVYKARSQTSSGCITFKLRLQILWWILVAQVFNWHRGLVLKCKIHAVCNPDNGNFLGSLEL
jgi:hypothetical protein